VTSDHIAQSALNPINSSVIATALVPIAAAMHVSVGRTLVLVSSLYLASAIAQPTAGKLAEEFGPRRVFMVGIVAVGAGGIVGGLAQNLTTLLVARVLIGIGTSAGYPSAMLMVRRRSAQAGLAAPPGNVLGGLVIAGAVTAAVGLPIGGLLVAAFSWRATFFINVPFALVTLAMAVLWIPRDAPAGARRHARELASRIDVIGIVGFAVAMTALLVFLLSLPNPDWIALVVAVAAAVALVGWELRAATPFFDVRLLATNGPLTRTYVRTGLTNLGIYTVLYGITQWIEVGRGFSAEQAGLLILPLTAVSIVVVRPVSGRNLVRGPLIVAAVSLVLPALGVLLLTTRSPVILIVAVTLIFGIALGTGIAGNQTALYGQASADQVGTAAGLFRTFSYIGSIASSAITGIVFRTSVTDHGLHIIAIILVAVGAVVLVMTVVDRQLKTPRQPNLAPAGQTAQRPPASTTDTPPSTTTEASPALAAPALRARQKQEHQPDATRDDAHNAKQYHDEHERSQPARCHAQISSTAGRYLHKVS
jgi:MFS family permease